MNSLADAESILVVDVGMITTRAILFDIVDGRYRFVAKGAAATTAFAPYRNIAEGVRLALDNLQSVTGRVLIGANQQLIIPSPGDGSGVDRFAATISAGDPLKIVVVGLLEDVSAESARRLAHSTYSEVLQTISLNDHRKHDARLNLIIRARPDLLLIAGGTNGGASKSLMSLMETIGLACYLLPESNRPDVLFAGNQSVGDDVKLSMEGLTTVHLAPNIRPTLELERLDAAQAAVASYYIDERVNRLPGAEELKAWAGEGMMPSATAFGRVVRFLSAFLRDKKGVLGVDLGASAVTVSAALDSELSLSVYSHLGLSSGAAKLLEHISVEEILRWATIEISSKELQEYLLNKSLHPQTVPATLDEMQIEQAIARQLLREAIRLARPGFPAKLLQIGDGSLPSFEPILATGSILTNAPGPASSALLLLDGLQPVGITTLVLDQNQIASAVGAAAVFSPLLAVQVMDSNSFLNLGTVIAPVVNVKPGQPVLKIKLTYESGHETNVEIKQGSLEVLPVPQGQTARLVIHPLHRADIGMGAPGRGGSMTVRAGVLGVVIDARGRPLTLPKDLSKRQELYKKWLWNLEGQ